VLVYEAPLVRNITSRLEPITIVSGSDIRTVLHLSRASFIDFALLLGTDFSQRIKNIGPQRALKFIRLYGSIEAIIQQERKYPPRLPEQAYLQQVEMARGVFGTLPEIPDLSLLKKRESDMEAVGWILQKYGLHRAVGYNWDRYATTALDGNYFEDDPSAF
jgi:flap endonuclease-1